MRKLISGAVALCASLLTAYAATGDSCSDPIVAEIQKPVSLPLGPSDIPPFYSTAYVSVTADSDGWMYLYFTPSVTVVEYAYSCDGEFTTLKTEYDRENNRNVGSHSRLEVNGGQSLIFRISGFDPADMLVKIVSPEPGASCDFPIAVMPGDIQLPAAAGDYYYRITPEQRSMIELTGPSLARNGYVEVMMDCNGWGAFSVYDDIWLRTFVYDRMEYLIHVNKMADTAVSQTFNLALRECKPYDSFLDAEPIASGQRVTTPPFEGRYYYRIPALKEGGTLRLATEKALANPNTHALLGKADNANSFLSLEVGTKATLDPATEYVLQWVVFGNRNAVDFFVDIEDNAGIETTSVDFPVAVTPCTGGINVTGENLVAEVYTPAGIRVAWRRVAGSANIPLAPGLYIVKAGTLTVKTVVR